MILQDMVVGYMGVPKYEGVSMTKHPQYITVRYFVCIVILLHRISGFQDC